MHYALHCNAAATLTGSKVISREIEEVGITAAV